MNFIAPEQVVIYFIDLLFIFYGIIMLKIAYNIITKFDFNSSSQLQYQLEKQNVLVSSIINFFIFCKIPLLFFFLYFLDSISSSIPGAMCAVGVLNSSPYGQYLVIIKVINLFLLGYWFVINNVDMKTYGFLYTKLKYKFIFFIISFVFIEFMVEVLYFNGVSPTKIVSCCGSVFGGEGKNFGVFTINFDDHLLVVLNLVVFFVLLIVFFLKRFKLYGIFSMIFVVISVYALIYFFSPYIYELPTHKCPFCILQVDYYYIGYLLYFFLLCGAFYGTSLFFLHKVIDEQKKIKWVRNSIFMFSFYLLIIFLYVISYYLRNGVWLK